MTIFRRRAVACVAIAVGFVAARAGGQPLDVEHAQTLRVGLPVTASATDRVDAARTGFSRSTLPVFELRTAWRVSLGASTDHPPMIDADGTTYVVGTRGEVIAIGPDGTEVWRVSTGANEAGPATLLSDGTLVFVGETGEAIAVHQGKIRWRTRFGHGPAGAVAPLPLEDGGVVVATAHEVAALDESGGERSRTTFAGAIAAPLVSARGRVVAVTADGAVWTWAIGTSEPMRVGTFGSAIDEGAALADDHTLVAIAASGVRMAAVDLVRGTSSTRAATVDGVWLGPPTMNGKTAYVLLDTATSELAVTLDAAGSELARTLIGTHSRSPSTDGGAGSTLPAPHTATLVDARGTLAFATSDGALGVVAAVGTAGAVVERLSDACPTAVGGGRSEAAVAGLAPLAPDGFVAACRAGSLVAVRGGIRTR